MNNPRAYTQEEIEDKIYAHLEALASYWARESRVVDPYEKCMGMAHSMLSVLGGSTLNLPAFDLIPCPHPDDKCFHKENGENWFPKKAKILLDGYGFYRSLEKQGLKK